MIQTGKLTKNRRSEDPFKGFSSISTQTGWILVIRRGFESVVWGRSWSHFNLSVKHTWLVAYLIWLDKTGSEVSPWCTWTDSWRQWLQLKDLPTDNGVRQRELQEEGLENCQLSRRSQTQTFGGQTEGLRLPRGDGVRNSDRNMSWSRVPVLKLQQYLIGLLRCCFVFTTFSTDIKHWLSDS